MSQASASTVARRVLVEQVGDKSPKPQGPKVCACGSRDCSWEYDPYAREIDDVKLWQYLCVTCHNNRADDV